MKKKLFLLTLIIEMTFNTVYSQNFYAIDSIQKIEITFSQSNWDYILDTAKQGSDTYTMATSVIINGEQFDSVGVKYKGNSSYNSTNAKNPLHIELDHFKVQDYHNINDIKLSNGFHDPSSIREVLLYDIARNYLPASNANYAQVYINGSLMGLYTNVEAVTKTFLESRFYSNDNTFVFADNGGCSLVYQGSDTTLYYTPYTMKSDFGWTDLANLCDTLGNNIVAIENILDIDRVLWMLAFTNVTVTLDSYIGNSKHNYYLYEDDNGRFNPIIWDLNGGLGIFSQLVPGPGLSVSQMQNMSPMVHSSDPAWPLVSNILANPMYYKMYIAHMRTIVNENFIDSSYFYYAQYLQGIIDTAFQSDPNGFYTYTEFQDNLTINVIDGPKTIPGLTNLMEARANFLNSTPEFLLVPPSIIAVTPSNNNPLLNTTIYITTTVTNATTVYFGSRNSVTEVFNRQLMFDDGLHGDGAAGDNVFGLDILMNEAYLQYYIYAENNDAGIFSPERAEHEYYILEIEKGIVINELMADNQTTAVDDYDETDDWIEFYNNSSTSIDLTGYYLSDDSAWPTKWEFPAGATIEANDFLIVWADGDSMQLYGLHTNFKLSASGESVILTNPSLQTVDEINFTNQETDLSFGRYPNGTGAFASMYPTFNETNSSPLEIEEVSVEIITDYNIYPNPASDLVTIEPEGDATTFFLIYNSMGALVYDGTINGKTIVDVSSLSPGIYFIRIENCTKKLIVGQ